MLLKSIALVTVIQSCALPIYMNLGLVVEDQPALACLLGETLTEAFPGISVRSAETLAGGRAAVSAQAPDIALVDLGLPDGSGIDLISELAASQDRKSTRLNSSH